MNTIEKVVEKLADFPELEYKIENSVVTIVPKDKNGFMVWLSIGNKDEVIVGFDGEHHHFDSEEEAIKCVLWGLSATCRLMVKTRGDFDYAWAMQNYENGRWKIVNSTLIPVFPFWKKKKVRYLQNKVITDKTDAPSFIPQ